MATPRNDNISVNDSFFNAVSWPAIFVGAFAASAVSIVLAILGSGLGFAVISPWSNTGNTITKLAIGSVIWLIVMQWLSSAFGGYLAGRLRAKWTHIRGDESYFRDTAHGFMAWAVATISTATVFSLAAASVVAGAIPDYYHGKGNTNSYYVDSLFRTDSNLNTPQDVKMETNRIFANALQDGEINSDDKTYAARIISIHTGLSQQEATERLDQVINQAKSAADKARKVAASIALFTSLSLVIGAFIASVAGVIGGRHRDEF